MLTFSPDSSENPYGPVFRGHKIATESGTIYPKNTKFFCSKINNRTPFLTLHWKKKNMPTAKIIYIYFQLIKIKSLNQNKNEI